jgi:MoaA/NifB/PqqE/SkfB family radical SAM enzyme
MSGPAGSLPSIQLHPTRRCNLRCLHCYSESAPDVAEQLDIEVLRPVIADAAALGYRVAAVSGGEPLTYEALPALLRAAHDHGLVTTVTTNGMLLDKRRLAWLEADADLVAISLDGVPESHDAMRASERAFEVMQSRLAGLRASGVPFTLTCHNVDELDWVAAFAVRAGASLLQIHPLESVGRAVVALDGSVPDGQENACALVEAARIRDAYAGRIQVQLDLATRPALLGHPEKVFACDGDPCGELTPADLLSPLVLEPSGLVVPMEFGFPRAWALGNIHDRPLRDLATAWIEARYPAFRSLCRQVYDSLMHEPETSIVNWYDHLRRAAAALPAAAS